MNRLAVATLLAFAAVLSATDSASAQQPYNNLGFMPWGFYQPYGATYRSSIPRPPYFATNPPVYYGSRHARPYGLSPFASPPMARAADNYESRLRLQFEQPRVPTPGPAPRMPSCNPCVSYSKVVLPPATRLGEIRTNPFVSDEEVEPKLAQK